MRRVCFVVLAISSVAIFPLTGALAKNGDGGNNSGGSDRSHEVRQNGDNGDNGGGGGGSGGTGTPDAGDNMHPSGNDKSVEPGGSYPQGHSQSDPDGMSNGGADKPGGTGGIDQDDQDGNNGCGNDDDFEDDNNGNCGGLKKGLEEEETAVEGGVVTEPAQVGSNTARGVARIDEPVFTAAGSIDGAVVGEIEPVEVASGTGGTGGTGIVPSAARVLGAVREFGAGALESGVLPKTGEGITTLLAVALFLLAGGVMAMRAGKSR